MSSTKGLYRTGLHNSGI